MPAHTNVHPAGKPTVVQIPENLNIVTPGENGVPMPKYLPAQGKVKPILQPKPVPALPLRIKDSASFDIQYLDVDQGIISSYIRFLLEDSHGYLWVGTSHGVSRYDGNSFIHYTTEQGMTQNTILSMLEDTQGDLWFGMHNGITRYDGNNFIHYLTEIGSGRYEVKAILEDTEGNIWFGTSGGVLLYDGHHFTHYTTREGLINDGVLSMLEDNQGNIWFGTIGGVSRFDGVSFTHFTTEEVLTHNIVSSITKDSQGRLWFGTQMGVSRYDGVSFAHFTTEQGLIDNEVFSIMQDRQNNLWFGSANGACRYDGNNFIHYNTEEGFSKNIIRSILEDSQGNMWFGTGGGGVNCYGPNSFRHFTAEKSISDNGFTSIAEDSQGNMWFGTGGGVSRYDGANFTYYTAKEGLISNEVLSILADSQGQLWFGTKSGVSRYNPNDQGSFTQYTTEQGLINNVVRSIIEDRHKNIWFGTWHGVSRYQAGTFTHFSTDEGLLSNQIKSILEDNKGNIWFGTSEGASCYNPAGSGTFTHYTTQEGLIANDITSILEDNLGNLWFGTSGNGVSRYDPNNDQHPFTHYSTEDGLSNNFIWSLVEDNLGNIWMSTEKGITLMRPLTGDTTRNTNNTTAEVPLEQFFTFNKESGLKRLDFQANSARIDHQNRIWWGTEGLIMLDLNQFKLPIEPPRSVQLTHIEINQQFVDYRSLALTTYRNKFWFGKELTQSFDSVAAYANYPVTMTLPHDLNHLTFYFSAIDWAAPQKIQYQYFMEGLDGKWSNQSEEPRADYRNLPHGSYTLKVKATGESQIWSEPFEYSFSIRPPWWHTWGAYIVYALIFFGIIYSIYSFLKKRLLLQNELKREQEESVRLKELDSFKTRLYTNLTHEFRTPLTIILGMTDQIQNDPKRHSQQGLWLIRQNGQQLLRLINQLLDLSKLENKSFRLQLQQGDIVPFLHYVTDSFYSYANSNNLSLQFFTTIEELVMDYDPEQIQQAMVNLLSNAVKFTPSGGTIKVRLAQQNNYLNIEVTDTGIGIPPENLLHIFDRFYQVDASTTRKGNGTGIGLAHTQELIRLMEGEIVVKSKPHKGTTFTITLPIHKGADTPTIIPAMATAKISAKEAGESYIPILPLSEENTELPHLLIIEDNPDVVTYLKSCLIDSYQLEVAFNGKIGIEKALENIPDLIISDVMMPEKDGYEVCDTLKKDERTSHIPIILLTAKADAESKISGLKTGADAYLSKPFDREELLVRLEMMVKNQQKLKAYFAKKYQNGFVEDASPLHAPQTALEDAFVERIREIVEKNYADEDFALPQLCQKIEMSRSQLYRKMKALIDTAPSDYIRVYRLQKAKALLETSNLSVSEVAWKTGFKDLAHFSKSFLGEFGYSPSNKGK